MISPLRLDDVELEKLVVRACPQVAPAGAGEEYAVTLTHRSISEPGSEALWHQVRVRLVPPKDDRAPHAFSEIDVVVNGRFEFDVNAGEDLRKKLYPMAAVSILFGVARGILAQATGICPSGALLLPPLDVTASAKRRTISGLCKLVPIAANRHQPAAQGHAIEEAAENAAGSET